MNIEQNMWFSSMVRELTQVIEPNQYKWAANMKDLLLEICKKVSMSRMKKLREKEYADVEKH
jgi:hypothetical protein